MNSSSIWAIWLCQNEVLFRGRWGCTADMVHDARESWHHCFQTPQREIDEGIVLWSTDRD